MWTEAQLLRVWYGGVPPSLGMRALEALYRGVSALRRAGYQAGVLRRQRLPVPVLVIGNLTAGGTGKTPLVIALVEALTARGWRPGVVSRGHGGSQREPALLGADPDPARYGDEPCLLRKAGCTRVAIGRDRPAAARLLVVAGADLVIADDGLQHHALARDLEICVIDGERRFGNGRLLPAGPLREPVRRLQSVDWRVVNGGDAHTGEVPMRLEGAMAVALAGGATRPLADFAGGPVHAVAGIGNPARFFTSLRDYGIEVIEHAFPDHHAYTSADLDFGDVASILMTAKDAVKCRQLVPANAWFVPVRAELPAAFFDNVDGRLRKASWGGL